MKTRAMLKKEEEQKAEWERANVCQKLCLLFHWKKQEMTDTLRYIRISLKLRDLVEGRSY
jgi:hypothetical protein